jgi:hypothetical protein
MAARSLSASSISRR